MLAWRVTLLAILLVAFSPLIVALVALSHSVANSDTQSRQDRAPTCILQGVFLQDGPSPDPFLFLVPPVPVVGLESQPPALLLLRYQFWVLCL